METTGREKTEMKIKTERVIIVTFLIVMLIIPAFCTADAPLPIRLLTGEAPESMRIVLSAPEVRKMSQFDDARTAQLNRLIRHLALDVTLGRDVSRTGILIDSRKSSPGFRRNQATGTRKSTRLIHHLSIRKNRIPQKKPATTAWLISWNGT